ncbi:acetyl-CoA C-acyltransferase [Loktanella sp. IMCC34160]|uniref:acetyl-CoA C-acyltransferase n=1 Tax=Loktanella sp. IMCC34160 TaxID=2510646 RepID=UPI00101DB832|nr:acetyl-CoA C-acyltransferase [Loktanella sp. IMCC34160]RYG89716.1 acetyl-CoA C-acyltransferase [Loktanella sp. IMCC34160]
MTARILAARRTAVCPRGGALSALSIHDLAAPVIRALLDDAGIAPEAVDEVILSNAMGGGGNPARLAALAAGLPETVAGLSIDRQCAGGLDAIGLAKALVESGQVRVVIAGGAESYSRRPLRSHVPASGDPIPYDRPPFTPFPNRDPEMEEAAAALAQRLGIGRDRQDAWAVDSHAKALAARDRLASEIVPVAGVVADSFTRDLTPALAARAKVITGPITHANAAVAADGAAFCLVVAADLAPDAPRITGFASVGGAPDMPGLAPVAAIGRTLAGRAAADLSVAEVMEAYAVQAIACVEGAGLDPAIVNPGGGALARGHPVGASGAVLAVRLFHEVTRTGGAGVAAIAAAGGIGSALVLEI